VTTPEQRLIAIDVALLPPPDVTRRAIEISASLPADDAEAPRLDEAHLPHITLSQHFVRENELDVVFEKLDETFREQPSVAVHITGGGHAASSLLLAVDPTAALVGLHERVMEALRGLERPGAGPGAFFDPDARVKDVLWVTGYRLKSSFGAYTPHITVGHGSQPPKVEPFTFEATKVAVCHLGRFCTCRRVVREWRLTG
jgi:2'-5' RNA ligase